MWGLWSIWGKSHAIIGQKFLHKTEQTSRNLVVVENLLSISSLFRTFLPHVLPQTLRNVCECWVTICPYGTN